MFRSDICPLSSHSPLQSPQSAIQLDDNGTLTGLARSTLLFLRLIAIPDAREHWKQGPFKEY